MPSSASTNDSRTQITIHPPRLTLPLYHHPHSIRPNSAHGCKRTLEYSPRWPQALLCPPQPQLFCLTSSTLSTTCWDELHHCSSLPNTCALHKPPLPAYPSVCYQQGLFLDPLTLPAKIHPCPPSPLQSSWSPPLEPLLRCPRRQQKELCTE